MSRKRRLRQGVFVQFCSKPYKSVVLFIDKKKIANRPHGPEFGLAVTSLQANTVERSIATAEHSRRVGTHVLG